MSAYAELLLLQSETEFLFKKITFHSKIESVWNSNIDFIHFAKKNYIIRLIDNFSLFLFNSLKYCYSIEKS